MFVSIESCTTLRISSSQQQTTTLIKYDRAWIDNNNINEIIYNTYLGSTKVYDDDDDDDDFFYFFFSKEWWDVWYDDDIMWKKWWWEDMIICDALL